MLYFVYFILLAFHLSGIIVPVECFYAVVYGYKQSPPPHSLSKNLFSTSHVPTSYVPLRMFFTTKLIIFIIMLLCLIDSVLIDRQ